VARGRCLAYLSSLLFFTGHYAEADAVGVDAVECLEHADAVNELVLAYSVRSQLALLSFDGLNARIEERGRVQPSGRVKHRLRARKWSGSPRINSGVSRGSSAPMGSAHPRSRNDSKLALPHTPAGARGEEVALQ